jgi:hypothetical protein
MLTSNILVSLCLECGAVYKAAPAHRQVRLGEYSHGYCEECLPAVELRWQKQIHDIAKGETMKGYNEQWLKYDHANHIRSYTEYDKRRAWLNKRYPVSLPDGPIADSPDGYKIIGGNV